MSKSISRIFCGIFRTFLSIFHAFKAISRFSRIVFALKIISENKKPIRSIWAEPAGPTQSTLLLPNRGPLEPIRAQLLASHGQHGLSAAAAFLGMRVTPRGPVRPYKAAASLRVSPALKSPPPPHLVTAACAALAPSAADHDFDSQAWSPSGARRCHPELRGVEPHPVRRFSSQLERRSTVATWGPG
jgi:hypothetical protein